MLPREIKPGDPITAKFLNEILAEIRWAKNISGSAPIEVSRLASGPVIRGSTVAGDNTFLATITKSDYKGRYAWQGLKYIDESNIIGPDDNSRGALILNYDDAGKSGTYELTQEQQDNNETASGYAREAITGFKFMNLGSIVRLRQASGQPYYIFDGDPNPVITGKFKDSLSSNNILILYGPNTRMGSYWSTGFYKQLDKNNNPIEIPFYNKGQFSIPNGQGKDYWAMLQWLNHEWELVGFNCKPV